MHGEFACGNSGGVDAGDYEQFDVCGMEWRADFVHGCWCYLYVYDARGGGDGDCDVYGGSADIEVDRGDAEYGEYRRERNAAIHCDGDVLG